MFFCGIDIAKLKQENSLIDEAQRQITQSPNFANRPKGGERLLNYFRDCYATGDLLALRQLCRHRADTVDYISDLKKEIICFMEEFFFESIYLFPEMFDRTSAELLSKAVTPEDMLRIPTGVLCAILKSANKRRFGDPEVEEIDDETNNNTNASSAFSMHLRHFFEKIEFLERQVEELEVEISKQMDDIDSIITTCPGVDKIQGAVILSEIGDISRFAKPKNLVAFTGITPAAQESDEASDRQSGISKGGSSYLRRAIWVAALVAAFDDLVLSAFYQKKIGEGKHHYNAICGVARKLTLAIYVMLRDDMPYVRNYNGLLPGGGIKAD